MEPKYKILLKIWIRELFLLNYTENCSTYGHMLQNSYIKPGKAELRRTYKAEPMGIKKNKENE